MGAEPVAPRRTRLIARGRPLPTLAYAAYYVLLLELPHFQRRMLLGIKRQVEENPCIDAQKRLNC